VIHGAALGLLRRHVGRRADDHAGGGQPVGDGHGGRRAVVARPGQLREAEVDDLYVPVARDHDVRGLHIAVHDPDLVRAGERLGHVECELDRPWRRQWPAGHERAERFAPHELHDDESEAVDLADLVDDGDVRMLECGGGPRFLHEARPSARMGDERRGQDLHGDVAVEPRVTSAVHLSHPARAHALDDLVGAEAAPRRKVFRRPWKRGGGTRERRGGRRTLLEEVSRGVVRREQRVHLATERLVSGADPIEPGGALAGRPSRRVGHHLLDAPPACAFLFQHGMSTEYASSGRKRGQVSPRAAVSARYSQAFATAHSRLTVAGDTPTTAAVSSTVSPAKNRSSTMRA
jgi:hypothetical protein